MTQGPKVQLLDYRMLAWNAWVQFPGPHKQKSIYPLVIYSLLPLFYFCHSLFFLSISLYFLIHHQFITHSDIHLHNAGTVINFTHLHWCPISNLAFSLDSSLATSPNKVFYSITVASNTGSNPESGTLFNYHDLVTSFNQKPFHSFSFTTLTFLINIFSNPPFP